MIARNVRGERARRGWRQDDLAERLGWSRASVGALETGTRRVTADHLPALCKALGVPFADLIRGADEADLRALGL